MVIEDHLGEDVTSLRRLEHVGLLDLVDRIFYDSVDLVVMIHYLSDRLFGMNLRLMVHQSQRIEGGCMLHLFSLCFDSDLYLLIASCMADNLRQHKLPSRYSAIDVSVSVNFCPLLLDTYQDCVCLRFEGFHVTGVDR